MTTRYCNNEQIDVYEITGGTYEELLSESSKIINTEPVTIFVDKNADGEPVVTVYIHNPE